MLRVWRRYGESAGGGGDGVTLIIPQRGGKRHEIGRENTLVIGGVTAGSIPST